MAYGNLRNEMAASLLVSESCFVEYQSAAISILRNKASSENIIRRQGISCRVCKPVFALSNKIIFGSRAPKEVDCEPCFVSFPLVSFPFVSQNTISRPLLVFCETRHLARTVFEEREYLNFLPRL